jgi:hypothetical protein
MSAKGKVLWLSILTNAGLVAGYVSTYIHNDYFRAWLDAMLPTVVGSISVISASVGILAGSVFFYEKFKQNFVRGATSVTRRATHRVRQLTPLELLELENPTLATDGFGTTMGEGTQ